VAAIGGLVLTALIGVFLVLRPTRSVLGFSQHRADMARQGLALVDLSKVGGECSEGYAQYLERAHDRVVPDEVLGCLARLDPGSLAESYLRNIQLDDEERSLAERNRRNSVSLMLALGEPAVPALCEALSAGSSPARWVAARALGRGSSASAVECLTAAAGSLDAAVRIEATDGLRLAMAQRALPVARAWEVSNTLRRDSDPLVREAAVSLVAMFDYDHGQAALSEMDKDADPRVAASASATRSALKSYHDLNSDLPY
jgi:hypothetical protein